MDSNNDEIFMPMPPVRHRHMLLPSNPIDKITLFEISRKLSVMNIEMKGLKHLRSVILSQDRKLNNTARTVFYHQHKEEVREEFKKEGLERAYWRDVKAVTNRMYDELPECNKQYYIEKAKVKLLESSITSSP